MADSPDAGGLGAAVNALYAAAPADFIATRKALAQSAKGEGHSDLAGEILRLRKPSVAAWVLNSIVRQRSSVIEGLRGLGERMRQAQSHLDVSALAELRPDRERVIAAVLGAAAEVGEEAGQRVTTAVTGEIRDTLVAALASAEATDAVASGHLTRSLSYSGFGEVDLSDAIVRTSTGVILTVHSAGGSGGDSSSGATEPGDGPTDSAADRAADRAAELKAALRRAEAAVTEATATVAQARSRAEETHERVEELEGQLAKARAADGRARAAVTEAVRARKEVVTARATAAEAADRG